MKRETAFFGAVLMCAGLGLAQYNAPTSAAETNALAEIRTQRGGGLIALQPWAQLMGGRRLGVGWMTSVEADGVVEWTQEEGADAAWRTAWHAEDGLRQAGGTRQRAVIEGYDPAKPLRFRAKSRHMTSFKPYKVTFGEEAVSAERVLRPLARADGGVSFAVFNDIHSRTHLYPLLLPQAGEGLDFAVFNGDVLQDPQTEADLAEHLLLPMAWFTSKGLPCFFLRGNHETRGAFARQMKDYLLLPEGRYYGAMTFGAARVVLLDCGEDKPDTSVEYSGLVDFEPYMEAQLAWLEREVAGEAFRAATWRVVVVHIPPSWAKEEAKLWHGERRLRERFAPVFDRGGVHVVISGHTHKPEVIAPCPDEGRGFRWPVFIGGAHPLEKATVIRVDATPERLRVARYHADGSVGAEQVWNAAAGGTP